MANPLDVSAGARAILPAVNESLPEGMSATIGNDNAVFIERSIEAVFHTIFEAVRPGGACHRGVPALVPASIIPIVTIPISLITTFAIMYALGFSVNTLTLLAFVLAIGLVVDDAIVVLENIFRHIEHGMKPIPAAIKGAREIASPSSP